MHDENLAPSVAADDSATNEAGLTARLDRRQLELITRTVPGGLRNVQDVYPLSPLQEGMLFHHLLNRHGDTYVLSTLFKLTSPAQVELLVGALQQVIRRHDVLRSAILWEGLEHPVQVVCCDAALPVHEMLLEEGREPLEQLDELMRPGQQGFDLNAAPIGRLLLTAARDGVRYAVLQLHHLVCDHQSLRTIVAETLQICAGRGHELPRPEPYRVYVAHALANLREEEAEQFFRSKLADVDEPTAPFEVLEVHGEGRNIQEARLHLDDSLAAELRVGARRAGVSVARLFHAAWALVVARTSGRDDVVYGTVLLAAKQRRAGAQRLLGMSVNTLPLRLNLADVTVEGLIALTQRELQQLLNYEHTPLTVALRCSGIAGSKPLFTTLLNYRHSPAHGDEEAQTSKIQVLRRGEAWTNYPVTIIVDDHTDRFTLTAQTDQQIDPGQMLAYLHAGVRGLLQALKAEPGRLALTVAILPAGERRQLIETFNATAAEFGADKMLHELFEEQVARAPDAIALVYDDRSLTYAQLNERANRLARYLRDRGVGPDQLVGVCLERSLEMVVALLGVLKAGGAYVPLDPSYPSERLQYMLADAAPRVLLTQESLRGKVAESGALAIALDSEWSEISRFDAENLQASALGLTSRHLAYVIYTSGSTGKPKGAMNEHRAVVNRLQWMQGEYRLSAAGRVLQKTPFSFDVSVWEFFWTLISGARLIIAQPRGHQDPTYLRALIEQTGVTTLHFVPSMLQAFLDRYEPGCCPSLRHIVCSGEELPARLQNRCLECFPQARLSNLYGPTEAAVDVTYWECQPDMRGRVPIGRPIANICMYVLDPRLHPVPLGVTAEIFIGGVGVGRGYWNKPELTAARFVADPFSRDPAARLYKTGDLGRWRSDGALEYLGRNDHQVKIRGLRIELGEIEAQLSLHPEVSGAVVVAREEIRGDKRLVAYVVPHRFAGTRTSAIVADLRQHLEATLPDYMVPSAFVLLERLPLSPNGKLDRRALPAPDVDAYVRRRFEAPCGEVEEILAGVWQGLLCVPQVGRCDNFFALGGHSLLIVQMLERLRRFGLGTELRRAFESRSLSELAAALTEETAASTEAPPNLIPEDCAAITPPMLSLVDLLPEHIERIASAVPGGARNIQDIYPLAPLQEGILFHHLLNERGNDTYILLLQLRVCSRNVLDHLIGALQAVIDRHDILRTAVLWDQLPRPVQVVYRRCALPVEELALEAGRDVREQLERLSRPDQQWLDIRRAPLLRLRAIEDPTGSEWRVVLQLHHLAIDHVTLETITEEVIEHLIGRADRLPASIPYREHVAQALAYAAAADDEAFFRGKLGDVEETTAPFGLVDVHGDGSLVREAVEECEPDLAQQVRLVARRSGVSVATLLHAAWALVVAHTSGRDDIVFGSVLLGRMQGHVGARRVLGMFINTLPLRLRLQAKSVEELVEQTQRELIELLSHEQASLATAQRCSGNAGTTPLFTALINYRHSESDAGAQWARVAGLELLGIQERTNYPLALTVDDFGERLCWTAQTDIRVDPKRVVGYLRTALRSLADALERSPTTAALALPVVQPDELHLVVETFNDTRSEYPSEQPVHEVFEEQVARTPNAAAVTYQGRTLSYGELNRRANRFARVLREHGVVAGQYVPIVMARSLQLLIAQIAVLKCGGAYVPIDPELPGPRRVFMVRDCASRLVIGDGPQHDGWLDGEAHWLDCGSTVAIGTEDDTDLKLAIAASSPAYVMYTSGSTGVPKGVIVPHYAVNRLAINNRYARIDVQDCIAHHSNPAFDASTFEIWGALLNGARVLIVPQAVVLDGPRFVRLLLEQRVTILWITVGLFNQYTEVLAEVFGRLRYLLTGGDSVEPGALRRILKRSSPRHLLNAYGPTECTTFATTYEITTIEEGATSVPIGKPIGNARIYIVDGRGQPVALGVQGEIWIGGAGVACGYLNQPQLTAERFASDPFSGDPQARLYKTGDIGRWRADGILEFLGRNDQQVKIRGFRIELGEIEAELVKHPEVREATVVALTSLGAKRLVAYCVPVGGSLAAPSVGELRAHVKSSLPEYMVPAAFVMLDRMPLLPTGKVDRRTLPLPEQEAYVSRQYEAPQGEVEQALAQLWQGLLGVDRVGRQDSFFELGGHSLLALRAVFMANQVLHSDLRVADLYRSPAIEELAACVRGRAAHEEFVDLACEALLDRRIVAPAGQVRQPPQAILLTGATGFVGRFLLAQLLRDTAATVYCLVRAPLHEEPTLRVKATLLDWGLWRDDFEDRIVGIRGDLRMARLGLDSAPYETLLQRIDSIFHCGTSMNHLETYPMAKAANVQSARELLDLATRGRPKLVNYISTLGVFGAPPAGAQVRVVTELTPTAHERHSTSHGYVASKWVGERIFATAAERGIACNIFRLGLVWADAQGGRYDDLQRGYRLLKSCLLSGLGIKDFRYEMPPTPVDHVARAIVALAGRRGTGGGVFHISAARDALSGVFERCNEILDTTLELVTHYQWVSEVERVHRHGGSLPIVPLIEGAFSLSETAFAAYERALYSTGLEFDCSATNLELEDAGIAQPVVNAAMLRRCLQCMRARDAELRERIEDEPEVALSRVGPSFTLDGLAG